MQHTVPRAFRVWKVPNPCTSFSIRQTDEVVKGHKNQIMWMFDNQISRKLRPGYALLLSGIRNLQEHHNAVASIE